MITRINCISLPLRNKSHARTPYEMKARYFVLFLCLDILGRHVICAQPEITSDEDSQELIDIDNLDSSKPFEVKLTGASGSGPIGSGYGQVFDDEDENVGSGNGGLDLSRCLSLSKKLRTERYMGVHIPVCDVNGDFKPQQCNKERGICWCVDEYGRIIPGSERNRFDAAKLNCPDEIRGYNEIQYRPIKRPADTHAQPGNGIGRGNLTILPIEQGDREAQEGSHVEASPVMTQPGLLAAIIGGAVVGLLCAVLLVMFIVYRMKKKDEGSYALDEPKQVPAFSSQCNRLNREYYA